MPKLKTHKGSAKRFKVTATGKVVAAKANRRHNLGPKKSPNRRRRLRRDHVLAKGDANHVHQLLPYA